MTVPPRVCPPRQRSGNSLRDSALGRVPALLDDWLVMNRSLWSGLPLEASAVEVARLHNANTVNCVYCRNVRYDVARKDGLTEADVAQISDQFRDSELAPRHKAVLAFVDAYLHPDRPLDEAAIAAITEEFSPEQIAHLSYAVLLNSAFSRCAVCLGGMPDDLPVTEVSVPGV